MRSRICYNFCRDLYDYARTVEHVIKRIPGSSTETFDVGMAYYSGQK